MIFLNLPINPFITFNYFIYIKISKNISGKYYQGNKKRLQKKASERYQNLSKEKKNNNMFSQGMKSKSLLSIEKNVIE